MEIQADIIPKKWIEGGSIFYLHPNVQMSVQTDREDPLQAPAMTLGTAKENCDFTFEGELRKGCTAADDLPHCEG
jgi:hypothetical protein